MSPRRALLVSVSAAIVIGGSPVAARATATAKPKPVTGPAEGWTPRSHWTRNADGTATARLYATPAFRRSGDGWVAIDPALRSSGDPEYPYVAPGLTRPVRFGSDRQHLASIELDGGGVVLSAPALRVNAPEREGDRLTYRDVATDADLRAYPAAAGIKHEIVLRSARAPLTYTFHLADPEGLLGAPRKLPDGGYRFGKRSIDGNALEIAAPFAYAAGGTGRDDRPSATLSVHPRGDGYDLVERVDAQWLRGRTFPVVLDPTISLTGTAVTTDCGIDQSLAHQALTQCGHGDAKVGTAIGAKLLPIEPDEYVKHRYLLKFDLTGLPPGATLVPSATTLTLQGLQQGGGPGAVGLQTPTEEWTTGATWIARNGVNPWASAGGSPDGIVHASAATSSSSIGPVTFGPGAGIDGLVADWIVHPDHNRGFLVMSGNELGASWITFATSTNTVSPKPALNVTFTAPPAAPATATASVRDSAAVLSWTTPSDYGSPILDYTVTAVRASDNAVLSQQVVADPAATSHRYEGLTNGVAVYFRVAARNARGMGTPKQTNTVTPLPVPNPPASATAIRGNGQVTVQWQPPASGPAYDGFVVRIYEGTTLVASTNAGVSSTSAMLGGLTNGIRYGATVTATNPYGESAPTPSASFVPAAVPGSPAPVTVSNADGPIRASWASAAANGEPVTGYVVVLHRVVGPETIRRVVGPSDRLVDFAPQIGHDYYATVAATNAVGTGVEAVSATIISTGVPDSPGDLSVVAGDRSAVVSWSAPEDGGSTITGYRLRAALAADGSTVRAVDVPAGTTTYTLTGLANGIQHRAEIAAVNSVGPGVTARSVTFTPVEPATANALGIVGTVAGSVDEETRSGVGSAAAFRRVRAVTVDGTVAYVGTDEAIQRVDLSTGEVSTLAGTVGSNAACVDGSSGATTEFVPILDVAVAPAYVYSLSSCGVRRTDRTTGATDLLTDQVPWFSRSLIVGPDGKLYVSANSQVYQVDPATGDTTLFDTFGSSYNLAADADYLYVATTTNYLVKRSWATGVTSTILSSPLIDGTALVVSGAYAYVNTPFGQVVRIRTSDGALSHVAGSASGGHADGFGTDAWFVWPVDLAFSGTDLIVADGKNSNAPVFGHYVRRITAGGALPSRQPAGFVASRTFDNAHVVPLETYTPESPAYPRSIAVHGRYVYVGKPGAIDRFDLQTGTSARWLGTGDWTTGSRTGLDPAQVNVAVPNGLATDGYYLYSIDQNQLRRTSLATGATSFMTSSIAVFLDIAMGPDGYLYVAESSTSRRVLRVDRFTGAKEYVGFSDNNPGDLAVSADADSVWITSVQSSCFGTSKLVRLDLGANQTETIADTRQVGTGIVSAGRYVYSVAPKGGYCNAPEPDRYALSRVDKTTGDVATVAMLPPPLYDAGKVRITTDGDLLYVLRPDGLFVVANDDFFAPDGAAFGADGYAGWRDGVNPGIGNFVWPEQDVEVGTYGPALTMARTYNSRDPRAGAFGRGWSTDHEMTWQADLSGSVAVLYGDGRREFHKQNEDGTFAKPSGQAATLVATGSGGYTLTQNDGTVFTLESQHRIGQRTDAAGRSLTYAYDGNGKLATVTAASGRALHFTWNGSHVASVSTDPVNGTAHTWTYTYTGENLTKVCNPRGTGSDHCTEYAYTGDRLTKVTRARGNVVAQVGYLPSGHVQWKEDGLGHFTEFAYDNRTVWVTDARRNTTKQVYDSESRLKSETDPYGRTTSYTYDSKGFRNGVTDANGITTKTTYDARGNPTVTEDGLGKKTYLAYDVSDNLTARRDPRSSSGTDNTYRTTFTYDAYRNRLSMTTPPTTQFPSGVTTTWTYTTGTEPAYGGAGAMPARLLRTSSDGRGNVTTYSYFANGDLGQEVDRLGKTTTYTYDALGRQLTTTETNDTYASLTTTYTYDELGNVLTETAPPVLNRVADVTHRLRTTRTYDANGNVDTVKQEDLDGGDAARLTTYGYDSLDRQVSSTDNQTGQPLVRQYDAAGNVILVTDQLGRELVTEYDKNNRAVVTYQRGFVDDPLASGEARDLVVRRLTYDNGGRPLTEADGLGRTRRWTYDNAGRATKITLLGYHDRNGSTRDVVVDERVYDAAGNVTTLKAGNGARVETKVWDAAGRMTSSTLSLDATHTRTTTITYDADGSPLVVAKSDGTRTDTSAYTYDAAGNVTSEVVRNGAAVFTKRLKRYDDRGLLVEEVDPRGVATPANEAAFTTGYEYDEAGRAFRTLLPPVVVDDGTTASTSRPELLTGYDTFGDRSHQRDARGSVTTTDYDRLGRRTTVHHPSYTPPGGSAINPTESWTYDAVGNTVSATDRRGRTTDFTYDGRNRVVRQLDPLATGQAARGAVRYEYDDVGERVAVVDQRGARATATYDDQGRLRSVTRIVHLDGLGAESDTATYDYDDLGNRTYERDPLGAETTRTFSPAGEVLASVDPAGKTWTHTYDVGGRVLSAEDPLHRVVRTTYDAAGRATQVDKYGPGGTGTPLTAKVRYDEAGNVVAQSTPRGVAGSYETTYVVDAIGRTTEVQEPVAAGDEIVTSFGYDAGSNVTRLVDGRGNTTTYGYNAWGLRTTVVEPVVGAGPATWTTVYDAGGLAVEDRMPGGVTVARTFDELGRLTAESGSGSGVPSASRQLGYDLAGLLTSASHASGTQTFRYDDRRLPIASNGPAGSATFGYDAVGRMVRRTDAAGTSTFSWTGRGELRTAVDGLTGATRTFGWDDAGQIASMSVGGVTPTAVRTYGYDDHGRLTSDALADSTGATQASTTYGYDADGNVTGKVVSFATVNAAEGTYAYGYDRAGRLTSMTAPGAGPTAVSWDDAGNRTDVGSDHYVYDARNRLSSGPEGTYTYTERGTLASVAGPGGTTPYTFDALGRMTARGGVTYAYDGLDRLASRSGVGLSYAGAAPKPVAFGTERYARSPEGRLLAVADGAVANLAGLDRHGDLTMTFGTNGVLASTRVYDPFGEVLGSSGTFGVDVGFQGDLTDAVSGQVWMGARWYDPGSASFTSRDTVTGVLRTPVSLNRYTYANGNPLRFFDPDGRRPVEDDGGPTPEQAAAQRRAEASRRRNLEEQARRVGVDPNEYRAAWPLKGPGSLSWAVSLAKLRARHGAGWDAGFEERWGLGDAGHILKQAGKNLVNLPSAVVNGGRNFVVGTANMVVDGWRDIYYLGVYAKTGKVQIAHTDLGKHVPKAPYAFNDRESRSYTRFMEDRTENALQVYYAVKGAVALYRGGARALASWRGARALAAEGDEAAAGARALTGDAAGSARTFTSSDPHVADVANFIEEAMPGRVVGVNSNVSMTNGYSREVDIDLGDLLVQVKSGNARRLTAQITETAASTGRTTIGYAPDIPDAAWLNAARHGVPIARTPEELLAIIRGLG